MTHPVVYKILVISDYRAVGSARPEAEIFIRLAGLGHFIDIVSYPEAREYNERFKQNGIGVIEAHPDKKFSKPFIQMLRERVVTEQYDFVHAFNSKGLTNAIRALKGLNTKLIAYRGYAGQTKWYDPTMYFKYFHPRVDHIICVSEDIRRIMAANMPFRQYKLSTIPKGHDPAWYDGIVPVERSTLGSTSDDILVCFLANVRPFKGLTYLLKATHLISTDVPFRFVFIGKGYDAPEVQQEIKASPFVSRIHVLGFRPDAINVLAACDSLVQVSTHGEGLSKSVLEAIFLGIPPIISDIPGNHGLIENGISGWVVPKKNASAIAHALTEMAGDPVERKRRGGKAKMHAHDQFHIDRTVEAYQRLYDQLQK
jgi:glycosyltransferase involved in cell wall biosynthesis